MALESLRLWWKNLWKSRIRSEYLSNRILFHGCEVPLHYSINGLGTYAGSCDEVMLVNGDVILIDTRPSVMGSTYIRNTARGSVCSWLLTPLRSVISTKTNSHLQ